MIDSSPPNRLIYAVSRCMVAFVWLYHGLVPKVIFEHADEIVMVEALNITFMDTMTTLSLVGWGEAAFGVFFLLTWRIRHMHLLNIAAMAGALINAAVVTPQYLIAAFNPVTLNLLMITLSVIGFIAGREASQDDR